MTNPFESVTINVNYKKGGYLMSHTVYTVYWENRLAEKRKEHGSYPSEEAARSAIETLSLIHISEPTRREWLSRMPSSA